MLCGADSQEERSTAQGDGSAAERSRIHPHSMEGVKRARIALGAGLQTVLGRESCFAKELVPLLMARGLAVPVQAFDVTVTMMGGQPLIIRADRSCTVATLKAEIEKKVTNACWLLECC